MTVRRRPLDLTARRTRAGAAPRAARRRMANRRRRSMRASSRAARCGRVGRRRRRVAAIASRRWPSSRWAAGSASAGRSPSASAWRCDPLPRRRRDGRPCVQPARRRPPRPRASAVAAMQARHAVPRAPAHRPAAPAKPQTPAVVAEPPPPPEAAASPARRQDGRRARSLARRADRWSTRRRRVILAAPAPAAAPQTLA